MKYFNISDFIAQYIKRTRNGRAATLQTATWQELPDDSHVGGYNYAKGSQFKVFETKDFGWIVFHGDTKTPEGHIPGKRILKW